MNDQEAPLLCPAGFPVPPGTKEWVVAKGDQGEPGPAGAEGPKGDKGEPLTPALRRTLAYLLLLALALSGANLLWTNHEVNAGQAAQVRERAAHKKQEAEQQAAQQKQAEHTLHLVCISFSELAANRPPAGNPATNPSRRYDQRNHRILAQLGKDLGCG